MRERELGLREVFDLQQGAARSRPAPTRSERARSLRELETIIGTNRRQFQDAVSADFGCRSRHETEVVEIVGSVRSLRQARRHLRAWMRPRRRSTSLWSLPGTCRVLPQPKGVVGIIAPWNYPIHLTVAPLTSAIAAGNRVMIKMSELTPRTFELLSHRLSEHFGPDQIWVTGGGVDEGKEFAALPFDHLLFTGSTAVGREVLAAAATNLTPTTLELGGKSPAIVDDTFAMESAAERVVWGKLFNAGQTCVAPDYVLVPKGTASEFAKQALGSARKLYPDPALTDDYTAIIDDSHRRRLHDLVNDARDKGATVMSADMAGGDHGKFPLTLLLDTTDEMVVSNEEIFGPILPIIEYETPSDAIAYVNERPRPLALYVLSRNDQFRRRVLAETTSGGATSNDTLLHYLQDDLPFGGSGDSGMGSYHGREGFDTFSHLKGVFNQRDLAGRTGAQLLYPPYGRVADALLRLMRRVRL